MSQSDADQTAAAAVVAHHTQLAADLRRHVTALRSTADQPTGSPWQPARRALRDWLGTELMPHAAAEEAGMYPTAAEQPGGRLLVDGMLAEHRAITALVTELETADTAVDAAAAGRALTALFEVHLAKENDLILPLLLDATQVSLADLLAGMHELLGADEATDGECGGECACGATDPATDARS